MTVRRRRVLWALGICVVLGSVVWLSWTRKDLVETFEQSASVEYPDGGDYKAFLWHKKSPGSGLGLGTDHYEVWLGLSPDYGHPVRFEATGIDEADISVEWALEGATVVYGSGHEVFVPAESFLGGR